MAAGGQPMKTEGADARLSRLSTWWTLFRQAHASGTDAGRDARQYLVQRYSGAVYRYLLGALRDEEAARELFQEFALRFLRGDFRRADPDRGRFRDYLKTALSHLVTEHFRTRSRMPGPLPTDVAAPPEADDATFLTSWREELLNQAWKALASANADYHAVLATQAEEPGLGAAELATRVAPALGRELSPGAARVTLHRARDKFAELLVAEVRQTLDDPNADALRHELRALGLLGLCGRHEG